MGDLFWLNGSRIVLPLLNCIDRMDELNDIDGEIVSNPKKKEGLDDEE